MQQLIVFSNNVAYELDRLVNQISPSKVIALTDSNSEILVYPLLNDSQALTDAHKIICPAGESNKNLQSLCYIWEKLVEFGADRRSLLINIGGGMISDLGGFAAATFKRGIKHINLPTTLLSAVDASVGGKTGIDFNGLKNEIGSFKSPEATIISSRFFDTLSHDELLSGYGEMLKHALLSSHEMTAEILNCDILTIDNTAMLKMIEKSVSVKEEIVKADPLESGQRKMLNLGHTFGHAFESIALQKCKPIPHGIAVAHGIASSLILSHLILQFPSETLHQICSHIKEQYPMPTISCKDYDSIINLMRHDKKNDNNQFNFTLLQSIGNPVINCNANEAEIRNALDIFQDMLK